MRFVVDNELRCSDILPSATDSMGNLVNYIQVGMELDADASMEPLTRVGPATTDQRTGDDWAKQQELEQVNEDQLRNPTDADSDMLMNDDEEALDGGGYERFHEEQPAEPVYKFSNVIPSVFTDVEVMEQFVASDFVTPPQLPPHLESVILNSNSNEKDNNSVLPIPNHVVLNHLATTSIKHNVLAVASISRYSRKYVTQILYAPL